jgi:hypothetical protein
VYIFDQHVGGEQQILGGSARPEDGAIVSDALPEARA